MNVDKIQSIQQWLNVSRFFNTMSLEDKATYLNVANYIFGKQKSELRKAGFDKYSRQIGKENLYSGKELKSLKEGMLAVANADTVEEAQSKLEHFKMTKLHTADSDLNSLYEDFTRFKNIFNDSSFSVKGANKIYKDIVKFADDNTITKDEMPDILKVLGYLQKSGVNREKPYYDSKQIIVQAKEMLRNSDITNVKDVLLKYWDEKIHKGDDADGFIDYDRESRTFKFIEPNIGR